MSRTYFILGITFLLTAFILSLLVSLSLPSVDVVRVDFGSSVNRGKPQQPEYIEELRLGVWNYCAYTSAGVESCGVKEAGYIVPEIVNERDQTDNFVISSSWTHRLVAHPVATVFTFLTLALSLLTYCPIAKRVAPVIPSLAGRAAPFACSLAAVLTLIALSMDIALFSLVKGAIDNFGDNMYQPVTATGFWLTLASLVLTIVGGGCIFFARRVETTPRTFLTKLRLPPVKSDDSLEIAVKKS